MPHPLFTLLSQRQETAPESPASASATSLVDFPPLVDGTQQKKRGDAWAGAGGVGGAAGGVQPDPWEVAPGVVILAIQDPPNDGGQPGRTVFKPGLTLAVRREILFDIEWFDVRVRRRQEAIEAEEL